MTLKEAIERYTSNAEYERIHGSLQGCLDFRQLAEWLKDYERLLGQEPCEDEYIKVPKMALKYRTAGMVAYNAEWLKNHFDIERAVICGAQEPCEDAISRQVVLDKIELVELKDGQSFPEHRRLWNESVPRPLPVFFPYRKDSRSRPYLLWLRSCARLRQCRFPKRCGRQRCRRCSLHAFRRTVPRIFRPY